MKTNLPIKLDVLESDVLNCKKHFDPRTLTLNPLDLGCLQQELILKYNHDHYFELKYFFGLKVETDYSIEKGNYYIS